MSEHVARAGGIIPALLEGAERQIRAMTPWTFEGKRIVIDDVGIIYHVEEAVPLPRPTDEVAGPPTPGVIPDSDSPKGYEGSPNGEDAHPHDDATGHVERTHEDFGPRLEKKHITQTPSWGGAGC